MKKKHCLYSANKKQCLRSKRDSYGARSCLYVLYLTKTVRIDFKYAVLNLYYQTIS